MNQAIPPSDVIRELMFMVYELVEDLDPDPYPSNWSTVNLKDPLPEHFASILARIAFEAHAIPKESAVPVGKLYVDYFHRFQGKIAMRKLFSPRYGEGSAAHSVDKHLQMRRHYLHEDGSPRQDAKFLWQDLVRISAEL